MRRRERTVRPQLALRSGLGAGVALAIPTTGALVAAAPAMAAPGTGTTTPSATTPTVKPVLFFGSRGEAVKAIQAQLQVNADGIFGPATLSAVKSFQRSNGLYADGIVGKLTWAKLAAATTPTTPTTPATPTTPTTPTTCSANTTTLRFGSTHTLVKVLQSKLGVEVDGIFGRATRAGVVSFQAQNGLYADGIVGKLTWSKLGCSTTTPTTPTPTTPTPPTVPTTPPTVPTTPTTPAPSATAAQIIAYAKTFQGVPYVWGGSTPSGFDCSGFVSYVFKQYGITMPRVSAQQQAYFPSTTNPQPGDLLFYGYPAYHVAIYLGDGMMIDAPHPGSTVGARAIYGKPSSYARVLR